MEEKEILRLLSQGDEQAFITIYKTYHERIYSYLLKFTKNPAQTEDLVHDVFMKVWEIRNQVDIQVSFSAYLYRFARNKAITQLNRLSLYDTIRDELLHRTALHMNDQAILNEIESKQYEKLLESAIDQLPPQRREAFILCRQAGKTYEEAAAIMNISRNTLKQHLSLAVRSIKEYLLEHGDISLLMLLIIAK